jgi:hypothetical protein
MHHHGVLYDFAVYDQPADRVQLDDGVDWRGVLALCDRDALAARLRSTVPKVEWKWADRPG